MWNWVKFHSKFFLRIDFIEWSAHIHLCRCVFVCVYAGHKTVCTASEKLINAPKAASEEHITKRRWRQWHERKQTQFPNCIPIQSNFHGRLQPWPKHLAGVMDYDCCINFICWRRLPPPALNIWLFSFRCCCCLSTAAGSSAKHECCKKDCLTRCTRHLLSACANKLLAVVEGEPSGRTTTIWLPDA